MFSHPALVAVVVLDAVAVAMLGVAALTAARVVLGWAPGRSSAGQLRLEARVEGAAVTARVGAAAAVGSTLLWVVAIAAVLPLVVPGAMCGTGVLQAMSGQGGRALALRGVALAALGAWHLVDRLHRDHPRAPLTVTAARALLVAVPLVALAAVETARALWALDVQSPVDCCAAVYDRVRAPGAAADPWDDGVFFTQVAMAGGGALLVTALIAARRPTHARRGWSWAVVAISLPWVYVAAVATVRHLAAYQYGVLHHRCPWCLFLPEHYAVGFALFGALAVVAFEGGAAWLAGRFIRASSPVAAAASRRCRRAALRVAAGVIVFWLVAGIPPLVWRIRFGTWMHG